MRSGASAGVWPRFLANHPGYEERTRVAVLDGLGTTVGEDQSRSLAAALEDLPGRD